MLFETPEFHLPTSPRMHPRVDRIRARTRTWVKDKGLLTLGIWDEAALEDGDYGLFTALAYPEASEDSLDLLTDWVNWGFFVDDAVEPIKRARNPVALRAFVERMRTLLPVDGSTPPPPVGPIEEALADLWVRSVKQIPEGTLRQLPRMLDEFIGGTLWEQHNDMQGRVPDPVDYVEMRRMTVAADFTLALGEWAALGEALSPSTRANRDVQELLQINGDLQGLHNDIVSFEKDVIGEGTINNVLLAVQNFFGGELSDAVRVSIDLILARFEQFELTAAKVPELEPFLRTVRYFIAGYFTWADRTGRYRVSATPTRISLHHPNGLGTAAVLVR